MIEKVLVSLMHDIDLEQMVRGVKSLREGKGCKSRTRRRTMNDERWNG